jgi:hypothetical protein
MNAPVKPVAPAIPPAAKRMSRETRKPFGSQDQKLAYPAREGFHRHWFNEIPGRIDSALEAGYTHVLDKDAKKVSRVVGVSTSGGPLTAWLLEIPEDWYLDDMKRQQDVVDEKETAIRQGALDAKPGENRYVPSRGITIKAGR